MTVAQLPSQYAGRSGLVVSASDRRVRDPGSNLAADGCVYRDSHCDMQPWARAEHLLQCLGQLSLASLRGRLIEYQLRLG